MSEQRDVLVPLPGDPHSTAVVRSANPMDMVPSEFRGGLQRRGENRKLLIEWLREALVDGVDFGAVPLRRGGFSKPSLRKPGAEKICGMLGVTATFPTLKDYERAALDGRDLHIIILRCHLISPDGQIVADGMGARTLEQDHGDLNKCLKMCAKSAHIDATLRMAGLSEIFTQDVEDMPQGTVDEGLHRTQEQPQEQGHSRPSYQASADRKATERQVKLVQVKLDQAGIDSQEFCEKFGIDSIAALPFSQVNPALHWISGVHS